MYLIGIDAGTTSVSGVLLNTDSGTVDQTVTTEHGAALASDDPDASIQDPARILATVEQCLTALTREANARSGRDRPGLAVAGASLTGQVHGILYLDEEGNPASPLYTWQDARGRRQHHTPGARPPVPGTSSQTGTRQGGPTESWADWVERVSGRRVPSGYGFLTHLVNRASGAVPAGAAALTTVLGFLAMRLTGAPRVRLEPTDAHTLGLFDLGDGCFDQAALQAIGVEPDLVPEVVPAGTLLGTTKERIPLYAGAGDNQAGFMGSVLHPESALLVNIGTSAQLSVYMPAEPGTVRAPVDSRARRPSCREASGWLGDLELRPFPGGGCLYTGASLAGGAAYRVLEGLFREVCRRYAGRDPGPLLEQMSRIEPEALSPDRRLAVTTQFLGTRVDPTVRGAISGIGVGNLTPDYLVEGFLRGIAREVAGFAGELPEAVRARAGHVVGVGNALRRNPLLKRLLEEELGLPVRFPTAREEAALGAAVIAGVGAGIYDGYTTEDRPIAYERQTGDPSPNTGD